MHMYNIIYEGRTYRFSNLQIFDVIQEIKTIKTFKIFEKNETGSFTRFKL